MSCELSVHRRACACVCTFCTVILCAAYEGDVELHWINIEVVLAYETERERKRERERGADLNPSVCVCVIHRHLFRIGFF